MRTVEIERDGAEIRVTWIQGIQPPQSKLFALREDAEKFAMKKMGARGCVISTLDMTPEQRAAHIARKARIAALTA